MPAIPQVSCRAGRIATLRQDISWWQFTMMVACANLSLLVTYTPVLTGALPPTRDAWLSTLLAALPAPGLMAVVYALALRFPRESVFDYTKRILGPFLGRCANVYLIAFFIVWASVAVNQ